MLPERIKLNDYFVTKKARAHGMPAALAHRIVRVESSYDCTNKNLHSTGIMKVVYGTARAMKISGNLRDFKTGLEAGMRYLRIAYSRAGGDWCGAATLYNSGVGEPPVRSAYCRKVLGG